MHLNLFYEASPTSGVVFNLLSDGSGVRVACNDGYPIMTTGRSWPDQTLVQACRSEVDHRGLAMVALS